MKEYYRVSGSLPSTAFELAVARWYGIGMAGCEELVREDGTTAVTVYFTDAAVAGKTAEELRRYQPEATVVCEPVVNEDWNAKWRESMQPARLADHWWVSPVWLEPSCAPGDRWIRIEPKMAFGTGHHETTRLAAQTLIDSGTPVGNCSLLDIGTGSGVLCFVAAMLGAAVCTGVEIDPDCRENLAENLRENAPGGRCSFVIGSLESLAVSHCFDIIVMNMIHTESAPLLGRCRELIAPGGTLVWSGILADEYDRAVDAARKHGFFLTRQTCENEWWCGGFTTGPE
jgi:ribosomal protein L11 methyltransferase